MRAALLLVALLAGCAQPARVVVAPLPELDRTLAAPCRDPGQPTDWADYDATDAWVMHQVLPALADCSRRHGAVVEEWEKARKRNELRNERGTR